MSKENAAINLQGTVRQVTHVKSKAYGKHVRAVRGTYKPATLNDALKKSGGELILSNLPAKIIKDAIAPYRENFKGGMFWQDLLSLFRSQYKHKKAFDFAGLQGWEVHKEYPLSRLLKLSSVTTERVNDKKIKLVMKYTSHPNFKRAYIDGYVLSVLAIYPVVERKMAITECQTTGVISLEDDCRVREFTFEIPEEAKQVLYCVKVEGCLGRAVDTSHSTKGMKIVLGVNV